MQSKFDRFTLGLSIALVMGALLACKKKSDAASTPSATATAEATVAPGTTPAATAAAAEPTGPKVGDVKRYPESEKKEDDAAVKILEDQVKVFNEADVKTPEVALLPKDLIVVRLASLEKEAFTLVDFPSGVGQFSPGWVETKFLEKKGEQVDREKVLEQTKIASIVPTAKPANSAKPASSTAPVASTLPAGSASAAALAASASAAASSAAKTAPSSVSSAAQQAAAAAASAAAAAQKAVTPPAEKKKKKKKKD